MYEREQSQSPPDGFPLPSTSDFDGGQEEKEAKVKVYKSVNKMIMNKFEEMQLQRRVQDNFAHYLELLSLSYQKVQQNNIHPQILIANITLQWIINFINHSLDDL